MLKFVKEPILLAFLIVSYNFALIQISQMLNFRLYPSSPSEKLHLIFFLSTLYIAWLFGERLRTVAWIGAVFVLNILLQAILKKDPSFVLEQMPAFLITLFVIKLFESPVEKRFRLLQESKQRLEEELTKNQYELMEALETKRAYEELLAKLNRDKEELEARIEKLTAEEEKEKELLLKEKEEVVKKLNHLKERLRTYEEKIERLTQANRKLFEILQAQQEKDPMPENKELSKLRQERKRLIKELIAMEEILDELSKENFRLKEEKERLQKALEDTQKRLQLAELNLEQYKKSQTNKKEIYKEILGIVLDNITWDEKALEEFIRFDHEWKREFLKELLLLNMKSPGEVFENVKGAKNVFKLKPKGGRIYFTYGKEKNWHILGVLDAQDDKHKERFIKSLQ